MEIQPWEKCLSSVFWQRFKVDKRISLFPIWFAEDKKEIVRKKNKVKSENYKDGKI